MKIKKYQKPASTLPKKSFWWRLADQLQSAPSNGETTIANQNNNRQVLVNAARKEAEQKGENPNKAEEETYKHGLLGTLGGLAVGNIAVAAPQLAKGALEAGKFMTTPVGKTVLRKALKETGISMLGGTAVDKLSEAITGMSFGKWAVGSIPGARDLYDRSGIAKFGIDMLNPGYLGLSGSKALIEGTQRGVTNLAHKVDNAATIANARLTGKLKFGNPTTYTGIHQSNTPLTEVKLPFNRWDVTTHGADPNGFWLTLAETPNTEGTMASRPFASRWTATAQKPLIQTGEIENLFKSKNNLRNAIVRYGKRRGADAFEFRGIKDNALPQTDVVMVTEGTDPIYKGGVAQVKYAGPTTGKTTFIKANPDTGYVDLDAIGEYKNLRKQIADQLGLDFKDPNVTNSPEYQKAFNEFITKWSQDINNSGKILYGSSKAMLRSGLPLDNRPFIPDFKTFVIRNQSRNFKENPEQLKAWYDSIIKSNPNIKINNRFISEIPIYSTPKTTIKSFAPEKPLLTETTVPKLSGQIYISSELGINPEWAIDSQVLAKSIYQPGKMSIEAQNGIERMKKAFTSNWMKTRLKNMGYDDAQINDYVKKRLSDLNLDKVHIAENLHHTFDINADRVTGDLYVYPNRHDLLAAHGKGWNGDHFIQLTNKISSKVDAIGHEMGGHGTEFDGFEKDLQGRLIYNNTKLSSLGKRLEQTKNIPSGYYLSPQEQRARFLVTAQDMHEAGYDPNSQSDFIKYIKKVARNLSDKTNSGQVGKYYDLNSVWPAFSKTRSLIPITPLIGIGAAATQNKE